MSKPTEPVAGCRSCGETKRHTFKCQFNAFCSGVSSPVLDSERAAPPTDAAICACHSGSVCGPACATMHHEGCQPPAGVARERCAKCKHPMTVKSPDEGGWCVVSMTTHSGFTLPCGCKCEFASDAARTEEIDIANTAVALDGNRYLVEVPDTAQPERLPEYERIWLRSRNEPFNVNDRPYQTVRVDPRDVEYVRVDLIVAEVAADEGEKGEPDWLRDLTTVTLTVQKAAARINELEAQAGAFDRAMTQAAREIRRLEKLLVAGLPWASGLADWNIVGMNHYHVEGERRLVVAMTNGFHCITAEGADEAEVFKVLEMSAEVYALPSPPAKDGK